MVWFIVHNATFNNILAISWRSVLLVEETGVQNYKKTGALDSQPQVIKFTSCLPMVGGSLRVLRLLPPLKLVAMIAPLKRVPIFNRIKEQKCRVLFFNF
jgi:hypothetical protein